MHTVFLALKDQKAEHEREGGSLLCQLDGEENQYCITNRFPQSAAAKVVEQSHTSTTCNWRCAHRGAVHGAERQHSCVQGLQMSLYLLDHCFVLNADKCMVIIYNNFTAHYSCLAGKQSHVG